MLRKTGSAATLLSLPTATLAFADIPEIDSSGWSTDPTEFGMTANEYINAESRAFLGDMIGRVGINNFFHFPGVATADDRFVVSRASEMLGACIAFGPNANLPNLSQADWDLAGEVGYEFTRRGPEGVREGLEAVQKKTPCSKVQAGPQGVFGVLYKWIQFKKTENRLGHFGRFSVNIFWKPCQLVRERFCLENPFCSGGVIL